jgi:general secretion pathway protein J
MPASLDIRRPRPRGVNQTGFTLVEVLVATTMLSLLLGVLFATFYTTVRAWDRADQYSVQANDIEAVQRFLRSRIASARPAVHPDDALRDAGTDTRITFIGEPGRISFVAPLPAYRSAGGLYLFVVGIEGDQLRLHYRPFHPRMRSLQPASGQPWSTLTLLDDVAQVRFRYLGQPHNQTGFGWHLAWPDARRAPLLVEMDVSRGDPAALHWPLLAARTTSERTGGRGQSTVDFGGQ